MFGPSGSLTIDGHTGERADAFAVLRSEFVQVARTGAAHPVDVRRGLHLQRLLALAEARLADR